ncbi:MAG TPA: aminotransferase class I/II-fold pyridoxal phosphate-dependent enzyme, partial [Planctomycetota bacterium]|nr:aminotransferase class I/II-fold pyridoxal phosphate-dependent enzyme [Planctomycetota bacterium]
MTDFDHVLDDLSAAGLLRSMRTVTPVDGGRVLIEGREFVSFAGNDYLGLRRHPEVVAGAAEAAKQYGVGAGASRLLAGTTPVHVELEETLARFVGRESALVFPSGYQTNVGVLTALAGKDDVLIVDARCHASLIDAGRLSAATMRVYPHANVAKLEVLLARH